MCSHSSCWNPKHILRKIREISSKDYCAICGDSIDLKYDQYLEVDNFRLCSKSCHKKFCEREGLFYKEIERFEGDFWKKEDFKEIRKHINKNILRKGDKHAKKDS
jgi:hypothetical protein